MLCRLLPAPFFMSLQVCTLRPWRARALRVASQQKWAAWCVASVQYCKQGKAQKSGCLGAQPPDLWPGCLRVREFGLHEAIHQYTLFLDRFFSSVLPLLCQALVEVVLPQNHLKIVQQTPKIVQQNQHLPCFAHPEIEG